MILQRMKNKSRELISRVDLFGVFIRCEFIQPLVSPTVHRWNPQRGSIPKREISNAIEKTSKFRTIAQNQA